MKIERHSVVMARLLNGLVNQIRENNRNHAYSSCKQWSDLVERRYQLMPTESAKDQLREYPSRIGNVILRHTYLSIIEEENSHAAKVVIPQFMKTYLWRNVSWDLSDLQKSIDNPSSEGVMAKKEGLLLNSTVYGIRQTKSLVAIELFSDYPNILRNDVRVALVIDFDELAPGEMGDSTFMDLVKSYLHGTGFDSGKKPQEPNEKTGDEGIAVGAIIEHEEEEEEVEKITGQLFIDGKNILAGVARQWRSILQRVYNYTRAVGNFYLIPLTKRDNYEGPAYNDDMLNQSYILSPDATFGSAIIYEIFKKFLCGETETRTKEMPWSRLNQYETLTVAMTSDSLITHIRPAVIGSANFRNEIEEGFNRFLQLINRSDCIITACDLSFICESSKGYRPMIITFTKEGSAINTINNLTDFVSTTMGVSVDTIVPTEDGAMIATFETEEEVDSNHRISGPRRPTSESIKIYTVSVKLTAMNTPPVSVKLDVTAEDETEALEVAKQQLKLYFKNESVPVYPKVIAESVYDLVSERPIPDK